MLKIAMGTFLNPIKKINKIEKMFWDVVGFLGLKYTSPYSKHLDSNGTCE